MAFNIEGLQALIEKELKPVVSSRSDWKSESKAK